MVMLWGLIIATFVDIPHRIIPDEVSVGGMIIGLIMVSITGFTFGPFNFSFIPMLRSLLGIIIGGGIIYLTGAIFDLVYFKMLKRPAIGGETESMGGGDVKLLAMIGSFIGWKMTLLTFFIAPLFGSIVGIILKIRQGKDIIPYGPYLSLAAVTAILWGDKILSFLFRGLY